MSSRSPSPPWRLARGGDADEPPMSRLPAPSLYGSAARCGLHTPHQPGQQEESGWESEEDSPISPPRFVFIKALDKGSGSPTSPPCSPVPFHVNPAAPEGSTFGSNTENRSSIDDEDDPHFKSLVDNFITAAADVPQPTLPDDDIDNMKASHEEESNSFAETALQHYNNDEKNKIRYKLISAITSCGMFDATGCYVHVNFTAKMNNQQNSKEELFFAELRRVGYKKFVPTCVLSLKGAKKVGGLCGSVHDKFHDELGLPMDAQHCYCCVNEMKHPKNGALYEGGHVACGEFYHG